jgi:hypothetical protein
MLSGRSCAVTPVRPDERLGWEDVEHPTIERVGLDRDL